MEIGHFGPSGINLPEDWIQPCAQSINQVYAMKPQDKLWTPNSVSFPGWQNSVHMSQINNWRLRWSQINSQRVKCLDCTRERAMEDQPLASLPLADFSLYPFPVINHNSECNSWWVLSPSSHFSNLRVVMGTPWTCRWCQKWGQSWGEYPYPYPLQAG